MLPALLIALLEVNAVLPPRPQAVAIRTTHAPNIDGVLDDPEWTAAPEQSHFVQKAPHGGAAPTEATSFRVLYDDEAIYIGVHCEQKRTRMVQQLTRRVRLVEADFVSVDIGTRHDGKSAAEFIVNISGVLVDALRSNDTDWAPEWDENWVARTHIGDGEWSVEMMIPFRILRFGAASAQTWEFQVRRYLSAHVELDEWAYIPRDVAGEVSHYGTLDGLKGLHRPTALELRPFSVMHVGSQAAADGSPTTTTDFGASAGLDAKWHPTQDVTFDGTLNPDFAQVEADQLILNISTSETYYPELRPFFLEGYDIFSTPFSLLYTRRIGRVPSAPALRSGPNISETLVDSPGPSALYGAAKVSGVIAPGWRFGSITAATAPNYADVSVRGINVATERRLVDPASSLNVIRIQHDLGRTATIGTMVTAATRAEPTALYPLQGGQELCPSGLTLSPGSRCFNNAYAGAIDFRWRSQGGDYSVVSQAVTSILDQGPARQVRDGTIIRPGTPGIGGMASFGKDAGRHFIWSTNAAFQSRTLDYTDLGYDVRANLMSLGAAAEYRTFEPWLSFLETHARLDASATDNTSGLNLGRTAGVTLSATADNFWQLGATGRVLSAWYDDREVGDGTALRRGASNEWDVVLTSDTSKPLSFTSTSGYRFLRGGGALSTSATFLVRVLPQFDVDITPAVTKAKGEYRFAQRGSAGDVIFGRLDAPSFSSTIRATYTFFPRLSLQTFGQLFLAAGHFTDPRVLAPASAGLGSQVVADALPRGTFGANPDFEQAVLNWNVVLRWEYRLGSLLYLVYTRSQSPNIVLGPDDGGSLSFGGISRAPSSNTVFLKLSYWFPLD